MEDVQDSGDVTVTAALGRKAVPFWSRPVQLCSVEQHDSDPFPACGPYHRVARAPSRIPTAGLPTPGRGIVDPLTRCPLSVHRSVLLLLGPGDRPAAVAPPVPWSYISDRTLPGVACQGRAVTRTKGTPARLAARDTVLSGLTDRAKRSPRRVRVTHCRCWFRTGCWSIFRAVDMYPSEIRSD